MSLAKTSKVSTAKEKSGRYVLAMITLHGQEIAQKLFDLFRPHQMPDDPPPDFWCTVLAIGRRLKDAIDKVMAADKVLFAANAALEAARKVRDEKAQFLSQQIQGLRQACAGLIIDLSVQQLGFDQRTPQDPVPLVTQAERVAEHLRSDEAATARRLFEGDTFDPRQYAAAVEKSTGELRTALDVVADERRRAEKVMLEKRTVTEEYDELFLHGARTFESYCRLAGKKELADRVRPSETRRGETEEPPPEVPDPVLEAPAQPVVVA
jgi:hypothetical protein